MAINFPDSPATNDSFTSGGKKWIFNGTTWNLITANSYTIPTGEVTTAKILDANVTAAKLASGAAVSNIGYTPANIAGPTFTGTVVLPSTTSIGTVSSTEIGYVDGVTSAIQTQLDSKLTATTAVTSNRNVIINGDMKIAQRGTSFSFPSAGGGFWWGADRFSTLDYTWTAGSNITVSQETSVVPTGFNSAYKIATGATGLTFGSGGVMRIRTFIEGFNMRAHYSKTMTLSFWVRSSIAGTYNLFLENGNWDASTTTRAFQPEYTISAANTWEKKTITIDMASATSAGTWGTTNGIGLGITWCLGAHANRTGDAYKSGWTTYSSIHMQTSTGTQWATNANATFYLTGVQLEAGSVATPFEVEDYGTTLAKCKRYYQRVSFGVNTYTGYYSGNGSIFGQTMTLPVEMRTAPAVSYVSTDGGAFYWVEPGIAAYSANSTSGLNLVGTATSFMIQQARQAGGFAMVARTSYILEAAATFAFTSEL